MDQLRDWVAKRLAQGHRIALAAVTWASGSTARGTDALMAMDESGAMTGTVGGGFAEGQTIIAMRDLLAAPRATAGARDGVTTQDLRFDLSPEASQSQMTCGGALAIHIELVEPGSIAARSLAACFAHLENGERAGIAFFDKPTTSEKGIKNSKPIDAVSRVAAAFTEDYAILEKGGATIEAIREAVSQAAPGFAGASMLMLKRAQMPSTPEADLARAFWLGFSPDPKVFIFGAGHVGLATCEAASLAGFSVTVTDDRPELLTRERFPRARSLRWIESFASPLAAGPHCPAIEPGAQDCALILTRKPDIDREMLASLLRTRAGYIGLIGSKTKRTGIFASLKAQGFSDAELARVHAPIGLAIGARTPEEISISIVAEIIAVRAGIIPSVNTLSDSAVSATQAEAHASAPRGAVP